MGTGVSPETFTRLPDRRLPCASQNLHGRLSGFAFLVRRIDEGRKSGLNKGRDANLASGMQRTERKPENGKHDNGRSENGHLPSTDRKAQRSADEAGLLLYPPAIRQSADSPESARRAFADCLRSVRCKGWRTRQKVAAPEADMLIREQVARTNVCLFRIDIGRA